MNSGVQIHTKLMVALDVKNSAAIYQRPSALLFRVLYQTSQLNDSDQKQGLIIFLPVAKMMIIIRGESQFFFNLYSLCF